MPTTVETFTTCRKCRADLIVRPDGTVIPFLGAKCKDDKGHDPATGRANAIAVTVISA